MRYEDALPEIPVAVANSTGLPVDEVQELPSRGAGPDLRIRAGGYEFLIEFKHQSSAETIGSAIRDLTVYRDADRQQPIPLIVVPYMSDVGRRLAEEAGVNWMDLSGNASIQATSLNVRLGGQPNRFPRRGRPRTLFGPKGSRLARHLLLHPGERFSQQELALATGLDKGYTSRLVGRLVEAGLVVREDSRVSAADPDLLLDAWAEDYDLRDHDVSAGFLPARSGHETLSRVSRALEGYTKRYAFTGLPAAWLYVSFATFRLVTVYVEDHAARRLLGEVGFQERDAGSNLWTVVPNDAGVFTAGQELSGMPCVSAVQVYLDLLSHPERASEAAQELRRSGLPWSRE
jgi:hypothetical protein